MGRLREKAKEWVVGALFIWWLGMWAGMGFWLGIQNAERVLRLWGN